MQHSNDTTQHDHQSLVRKYYRYINIFSGVALIQLPMLLASIFFFATKNFEMKKKPHIRQNIYNETPWNTWACNCNKYDFLRKLFSLFHVFIYYICIGFTIFHFYLFSSTYTLLIQFIRRFCFILGKFLYPFR